MEEETKENNEKQEEVVEKPTGDDVDAKEGLQSKTVSELDRADEIAERQKRENDRREELITRDENLAARKAVGGEIDAGKPAEKKEETDKEYKDRVMANDPSLTEHERA